MSEEDLKELQPELLLTFGGMIVSKKIKAFLREYQPKHHWHLDEKKAYNTFFCLNKHFETSANSFLGIFLGAIQPIESSYYSYFEAIRIHRYKQQLSYLDIISFSDFKAFDQLLTHLPKKVKLQLGNSSTIRYCQLFELHPSIAVYCNRGTSGIEGTTSTAIGASVVSAKQTVLITGDLSFFYDSNALWNNYIPPSFRIIVINNGGGGIFRILPGDKNTANFETYFETKHQLTARQLCEMYGFEYESVNNEIDLRESLTPFYQKSEGPKLLEIQTPSSLNDVVLLDYFKHIR
jgi:2-succinyl-5-enolpyruvyl-6-hydroxy-3-cyclohexene-1-carboxylate synthase